LELIDVREVSAFSVFYGTPSDTLLMIYLDKKTDCTFF